MPEWYEGFFRGVVLDLWRQAMSPEQTRADADLLVETLQRDPPARLLDVPCGNGRISLELARRGFSMSGLDISEEFVAEARAASTAKGLDARWVLGDMRRLEGEAEYDGAFSFGNSFGYLAHDDTRGFLARLSRALKPGARFVLDTGSVAESLLPALKERIWYQVGDILMAIHNVYLARESCLQTDFTFVRDGKTERCTSLTRVYTVAEIGRLLEEAGMELVACLGESGRDDYRLGDPRLIAVAQRPVDS
jgi:ubiquinone/menaquinone biosynthesis C-methylase UbiE